MKTVLVTAIKGGVGKTTVTAGLGRALARAGQRVAFMDLDLFAPNLDVELGAIGQLQGTGDGQIIPLKTREGFELVSMGSLYLPDQAVTLDELESTPLVAELLRSGEVLWDSPDFLIVDTAPTSGAVIQASLAAPGLLGAVIVTHASSVARADLLRSLSLMRDRQVPLLGVVVNQAVRTCGKCGHQERLHDLWPQDIEEACTPWQVPVLASLPHGDGLQPHFDTLATIVLRSAPAVIKGEAKPGVLPRKILALMDRGLKRMGL